MLANTCARYPEAAQPAWRERIEKVQQGGLAAIADTVIERYFSAGFRAAAAGRPSRRSGARCCAAIRPATRPAAPRWPASTGSTGCTQIRCPTLVIAGAEDVGAPVAMSEAMAERIPGAELVVIDDASHLSVVEQPAQFGHALHSLLDRLKA